MHEDAFQTRQISRCARIFKAFIDEKGLSHLDGHVVFENSFRYFSYLSGMTLTAVRKVG